jgi:hypothetical protein
MDTLAEIRLGRWEWVCRRESAWPGKPLRVAREGAALSRIRRPE